MDMGRLAMPWTSIGAGVSLALAALLAPVSAAAQARTIVSVETVWTQGEAIETVVERAGVPARYLARFGPFFVTAPDRATVAGIIDTPAPDQFAAMLRAFPGVRTLDLVELPGTEDSDANLKLARAVRRAGIETHVPADGSVRSGGVELFLAGARRTADEGAEFAVHSWEDEDGREARDFASDSPEHAPFIDFYRDMGMTDGQARAFYALTNSVGFADARWLYRADMAALHLIDTP